MRAWVSDGELARKCKSNESDVNECQIGTHDCMDGQRCDNTVGSFLCSRTSGCGTGYTLNYQTGICEDDDECVLETHNCRDLGPEFACRNTLGSYRCEKVRPQTAKPILPTTRQPLSQPQPPGISGVYNFLNGQLMRCLPGYRRNFLGECEGIQFSRCFNFQKQNKNGLIVLCFYPCTYLLQSDVTKKQNPVIENKHL